MERQNRMRILARATASELDTVLAASGENRAFVFIRPPEIGLTMVRARAGGTGQRFNMGEATTTRCSVRLPDGREGHAYILGRSKRRAEKAALADALLLDGPPATDRTPMHNALNAIAERQQSDVAAVEAKAAATKVDFFTLVRGT